MTVAERKSQKSLDQKIKEAAGHVEIGARYMHYKQQSYKVLDIALLEETNEPCVIYRAEYGLHVTFIRPLRNWIEELSGMASG